MNPELEAFRQHWTDALAAFGAHIEIHRLPAHIENRQSFSAFLNSADSEAEVVEQPVRVVIVGREQVSGAVLVEMDKNRERIVQAFPVSPRAEKETEAA